MVGTFGQEDELARRASHRSLAAGTVDDVFADVDRLCRAYSTENPAVLRVRATAHLRYVLELLGNRTTLEQHRDLLVLAGWDVLLLGCVAYDVGDPVAANQARRLAYRLGDEAGHGEVMASRI
jgi:hypothetical protein